ncbi:MAG: hypothetical protein DCC67_04995 [Planctomycetota bacterium]|nr:MAG: hypothetical protein DCC67_04995 [Planctomycetota bacterium]
MRISYALTAIIALSMIVGCDHSGRLDTAEVTGTVTLDGQPLSAGTILFRPESGRAGRGKVENGRIVEASTYGINDGIVLGEHKIAIQPIPDIAPVTVSRMEDPTDRVHNARQLPSYAPGGPRKRAQAAPIPAKYHDPDQSGLTANIDEDGEELLLKLTSR